MARSTSTTPSTFRLVWALLSKEFRVEFRQKYAINGILLYVFATVFVVYFAFEVVELAHWIALFWIIVLFASVNAVAKSFLQESRERMLYFYTLVAPQYLLAAKMLYNTLLLVVLTILTFGIFGLLLNNPVEYPGAWSVVMLLGSAGFALAFTMVSAIASKAQNNATLMTILSIPVILPRLGLLVAISRTVLATGNLGDAGSDILSLVAIDVIVLVVSFLLFPYLWRE